MTIPVGYAQINWVLAGSGLPTGAEFTCGVDVSSYAGSIADLAALAADEYDDQIAPSVVAGFGLTSVHVKYGPDDVGPSTDLSAIVNGERAGNGCPPNTSWLITKNTALGGRAGRGRMFIPGVLETDVDNAGVIGSGAVGILQVAMTLMLAHFTAADAPLVVLHQPGSPISLPTVITQLAVSSRVATQRQRLRR